MMLLLRQWKRWDSEMDGFRIWRVFKISTPISAGKSLLNKLNNLTHNDRMTKAEAFKEFLILYSIVPYSYSYSYINFSLFCRLVSATSRKIIDPVTRMILFLSVIIAHVASFTSYGISYGFRNMFH
jgi:hypothetical protein